MAHYLEIAGIVLGVYLVSATFKLWSLYYRANKAAREYGCRPANRYPNQDPFFGIDLFRLLTRENERSKRIEVFVNLHRKYGETFQFKAFSGTRISTCSPKNLQAIGATKFDDWAATPLRGSFAPFMTEGVLMSDGEEWKRSRALVRPTFNRSEIADLENFEVHVERFLALIPRDGRAFDLQPLFKNLFLDTSSEFSFGQSVESLLPNSTFKTAEFMGALDDTFVGLGIRRRAGPFQPLLFFTNKSWKKAYTKVHEFVDKNVQIALRHRSTLEKTKKNHGDGRKEKFILLNEMTQKTQDPHSLRSQILNVFLPGRDTSAVAITNVFFELVRHPHVWDALRTEVQSIGDQPLTFELIKNLKVAKAIISETLRLHIPGTLVQRIAIRDTILPVGGGPDQLSPLFVPKGTCVQAHMLALHRNPEYWGADVDEFKPERWGEGRPLWEGKWQYVPFFGGPRMCPAQQMVLTQITYLLVRLAQEFKGLENRDEVYEWLGRIRMTVESKNGAQVSLTPAR